jgi:hypothetical protein
MLALLRIPSLMTIATVATLVAIAAPVHQASAQLDVAGMVQPHCTRQAYADFCQAIGTPSSQRAVIDMVWLDYAQSIDTLLQEASDTANTQGRQRVLDALDGKIRLSGEEIATLRIAVLESTAQWQPRALSLADQLLDSTLLAIDTNSDGSTRRATQAIRRTMLLHVLQDGAGRRGYAGEGLDMIQLITAQQRSGESLEGTDALQIARIAASWAAEMDSFLTTTFGARQESQLKRRIALIGRDGAKLSTIAHEDLVRWARQQEINQEVIDAIDAILAGDASRQWRWRGQVKMMMYPWLYRIDEVDGLYEWIVGYSDDEALQQQAATRYETYRQHREAMRDTTIALLLRGRRDHSIDLHDASTPPPMSRQIQQLKNRVLQASGEQSMLTRRGVDDFDAMLGESRRSAAHRYARRRTDESVSGSPE